MPKRSEKRGLVDESSGPETATHKIGTDTASGRQRKNALGVTNVGAVEGIAAESTDFGLEELGIHFIVCDLKTASAKSIAKELYASYPAEYHPKSIAEGREHMTATIDGRPQAIQPGERLIDLINRCGIEVPHVCYHPQLGPIQTCDTCMVEVDGKLLRACGTMAAEGMNVATASPRADAAQREAFDRILGNHLLYCTVCDNNNGNCTVHNTTKDRKSVV